MAHIPVLLQECLTALNPKPGEFHIDGTLGAGGHAREILKRITPGGTLLAVDRDPRAAYRFKADGVDQTVRLVVEAGSYATLPAILNRHHLPKADGLLLDLGFSSEQITGGELVGRGFSFTADEPLLMTYDDETPSVAQLLAELSVSDLATIIREYGEERYAQQIADSISRMAKAEGIATTGQLVTAIKAAVPAGYEHGRLHPATRTFQALRIYANGELRHLETLLEQLPHIVRSGGRVAIISFHSLEDRIVKNYFRQYMRDRGGRSVGDSHESDKSQAGELPNSTSASPVDRSASPADKSAAAAAGVKKPIVATEDEMVINPRSRSAKLRVLYMP